MTVAHPEIRVKITALQAELRRLTGSTALIVYAVEETRTRSPCVMYSENEVQDRLKNGDWETAQAMRKVESYFENTAA